MPDLPILIRRLRPAEIPLLADFLYYAIYIPAGTAPPERSILALPELQVYLEGFGTSAHDRALVAVRDDQPVGCIWARIMHDFGHIDDRTPSLAMSVLPAHRGQGVGTSLLRAMLDLLRKDGYAQVSLSVQKANDAVRLYRAAGFRTVREHTEELIMACRLN